MSDLLDTTIEGPIPGRRASDRAQAAFRRRVAYYSLLMLTLISGALIQRDTDIGPNVASLLAWIVVAFCVSIVTAISAKAAEAYAAIMASRGAPR